MADEEQDQSSKTEDPTQHKLDESRRRGQVPLSREVNTWILLLASTFVVTSMGDDVARALTIHMRHYLEFAHSMPTGPGGIAAVLVDSFMVTFSDIFMAFIVLVIAAFAGPFAQVGPLFAPETIKPSLQKISIIKGVERLFSMKSIIEFLKGLIKITVVSVVTYFILKPYLPNIEHMVGVPMSLLLQDMMIMTTRLLTAICVVMMIFAGLDLAYQRFEYYQRQRMTKDELKDEIKQTEGDPAAKGRLRQLRLERSKRRMMQSVPTADVVITNPTHFAIALQYDPDKMAAPKVVAKGADFLAARIREIAKDHKIEIVENPPLARALYEKVEVDQYIPIELYKAVADVISYVFRKSGKLKKT